MESLVVGTTSYSPTVRHVLTVRGLLTLGKTADELRSVGYTAAMAREDGWMVDTFSYPWCAYVGDRFNTDAFVFLHEDDSLGRDSR